MPTLREMILIYEVTTKYTGMKKNIKIIPVYEQKYEISETELLVLIPGNAIFTNFTVSFLHNTSLPMIDWS